MPVSNNFYNYIKFPVNQRDKRRAKYWFKALLEGQYLARLMRNHISIVDDLDIVDLYDPVDPLPMENLEVDMQRNFMFQMITSQLKNSQNPQKDMEVVGELRKSKDHIKIVDGLIKTLKDTVKTLEEEKHGFEKAYHEKC